MHLSNWPISIIIVTHLVSKNALVEEKFDLLKSKSDKMFYFVFLKFSASREADECEGQNTIRLPDGKCKCLDNFPFGDPNSKDGCYKCFDQCHEKAICSPPGKCKCIKGLVGDGKLRCEIPKPQMIDIYPKKVSKAGGDVISVNYTTETNYSAIKSFCKFGNNQIIEGKIVNEHIMNCVAPASTMSAQRLSISLDNVSFTDEQFFVEFLDINSKPVVQVVWQVWAVVLIVIFAAVIYFKLQKPKVEANNDSPDERVAFTKKAAKDPVIDLVTQNDKDNAQE